MKFLRFFSSVKLAIVLIIVIVVVSILGTLIPQQRAAAEYADRYGQLSGLMMALRLTNLYRSAWYLALLGMFALNILVCTLTRLSPKLRRAFRPRVETEAKALEAVRSGARFKRKGTAGEAAAAVKRILAARRYRVRETSSGGRVHLLARKRVLGLFGSDVVHLGLLVILAGGIISGVSGVRTYLSIKEGETARVPGADFHLRLDRFETELYPDGSVRDWKSRLTVLEGGREVLTKVVEVNHPLSYGGILFYQNSYGADPANPDIELWVRKSTDPGDVLKAVLKPGESASLGPGGPTLGVLQFVPDFVIGEDRQVATRSAELNNPAARVELQADGRTLLSGWVFANYPEFAMMHSQGTSDYQVEFKSIRSNLSVLEAARDPGAALIWIGCGLLMAGLFLAFYWSPREVRFVLAESQGKTDVLAAALGSKGREALETEFEGLIKTLRG